MYIYLCVCVCLCTHTHTYTYIYIYIERERDVHLIRPQGEAPTAHPANRTSRSRHVGRAEARDWLAHTYASRCISRTPSLSPSIYIYIDIYTNLSLYIYINICKKIYIYIYTYIYIYIIYIYTYIYIYIYIYRERERERDVHLIRPQGEAPTAHPANRNSRSRQVGRAEASARAPAGPMR